MSCFLDDADNIKPHAHCSRQMIAGSVSSSSCASTVRDEDGASITKQMHVLRVRVEESERLLQELYSKRQEVDVKKGSPVKEGLRVSKSVCELEYKAEKVHAFNKKNLILAIPLTWGEGGMYNRVKCVRSLRMWLDTHLSEEYGLDRSYEDDFQVFQNGSILHTLDGDFKGGVGVFALWIPSRKHNKFFSKHWASRWHMENDPRTQYADPVTGKAWVAT